MRRVRPTVSSVPLSSLGVACVLIASSALAGCTASRPTRSEADRAHASARSDSGAEAELILRGLPDSVEVAPRPLVLGAHPTEVPWRSGASPLLVSGAATPAAGGGAAGGGAAGGGSGDLAKQLSNPVSSLISVPFENSFDSGVGPDEDTRYTLTLKPVVPIKISSSVNLIQRALLPFIDQPTLAPGVGDEFGMGDLTLQSFFSPSAPSKIIWGAGPVFTLPTATDDSLGSETWTAGPAVVVLTQKCSWTMGLLATHSWSVAKEDDSRPDISSSFLQPILSYGFGEGFTVSLSAESSYDWENERWTVPLGVGLSKIVKIGRQPLSIGVTPRVWVEGPDGGPEWGVRFTVTFLFPKK